MSKQVDVVLKLNDQFSSQLKSGMGTAVGAAAAAATALAGVATAAAAIGFSMASTMENIEQQFTPLLGGADKAQARLKELSTFAANTPFALKEVAGASKTLETLSKGVLSTGEGLTLVGDAAAVAGVGFEELSVHVGRAYSNLNSNRAAGESISRMQELGLISGETRNKIEDLQKAGKGKEAWTVLQNELKKTSGAMDGLSNTFSGRLSTLKDNVGLAMADMVKKFGLFDVAKNLMKGFTDKVSDFAENTDFTAIGQSIVNFANNVINSFRAIIPNLAGAMTVFQTLGTVLFNFGQIIVDSVVSNLGNAGVAIKTIVEAVVDLTSGNFSDASKGLQSGFDKIGKNTKDNAIKAIGNFKDMGTAFTSFKDNYTNNVDIITAGADKATSGVKALSKAIDENADKVVDPSIGGSGKTDKTKETASGPSKESLDNAKTVQDALDQAVLDHTQTVMSANEFEILTTQNKYAELEALAVGNTELLKEVETARVQEIGDIKQQQAEENLKLLEKQTENELKANAQLLKEAESKAAKEVALEKRVRSQKEAGYKSIGNSFADMTSMMAKENKKYAVLAKVTAHGQAAVNTAVGATKALELPYPMNLIAMGSVVAAGLVQQAKIAQQKFADGGIVQGSSTYGDKTVIRANAKEAVLTTGDQKELLDIARGNKSGYSNGSGISYAPNLVVNSDNDAPTIRRMLAESAEEFKSFVHSTMKYDTNVPEYRGI